MRVTCSTSASETFRDTPDLLVLPEGVPPGELEKAQRIGHAVIVVAATADGPHMRGVVMHRGSNRLSYLKTLSDGRSSGSNRQPVLPVYETSRCAIGLLICRDIENVRLCQAVLMRLRSARAPLKVLCIPADMGEWWFPSDPVIGFGGVHLAMSNHTKTHTVRRHSFIADPAGVMLIKQVATEPISALIFPV